MKEQYVGGTERQAQSGPRKDGPKPKRSREGVGNQLQNPPRLGAKQANPSRLCSASAERKTGRDPIRQIVGAEISDQLKDVERQTGLSARELLRIGANELLGGFKETGRVTVGAPIDPPISLRDGLRLSRLADTSGVTDLGNLASQLISYALDRVESGEAEIRFSVHREKKSAPALSEIVAKAREIDEILEMPEGVGVVASLLSDLIRDVREGEYGMILEGWDFDGGTKWAASRLAKLSVRWKETA